MTLAQRVRDHRYTKGWGPDELASRAEISRTALYQIESGKTELPRAGTLRRIAIALEVPMETLLGYQEAGNVALSSFLNVNGPRRVSQNSDWIPSEGGALTTAALPLDTMLVRSEALRFGVECKPTPSKTQQVEASRDQELVSKLLELLASPMGEGIARIVEEAHRLLPPSDSST
jgi:DNA-binding XRE family transcriptional regulator